jgi:predicted nucleic acid-binding protein
MAFTALLDANVLYSAPLTDLLLRIAAVDVFRLKWSADIHDEWMGNLSANRPDLPHERIARRCELMDQHARDVLVEGYAPLIPSLTLPDPNDRHVLAAAIVGRVDLIVTYNRSDFPAAVVAPYGIDVQHPDEFLSYQFDLAPALILSVIRDLRAGLTRPPISPDDYLNVLARQGLPTLVARLRPHVVDI